MRGSKFWEYKGGNLSQEFKREIQGLFAQAVFTMLYSGRTKKQNKKEKDRNKTFTLS